MLNILNSRIALSGATILAAGALVAGAAFAFFSDTETSQNNVLAAGELNLKIDSEAHYAGLVCSEITAGIFQWIDDPAIVDPTTRPELLNTTCEGTWSETDLTQDNVFFSLNDIKPGDSGENTISLHVYNNDAWGRMIVSPVQDLENACTEPELDVETTCEDVAPAGNELDGELREAVMFNAWLDQGAIPGFQNIGANGQPVEGEVPDPTEGDNIRQSQTEPIVISDGILDTNPELETFEFAQGLAAIYAATPACTDTDGNTNYTSCHGLAEDGRMVASTTYYMGVEWILPDTAGNEVQTDSLIADVSFEVVQHRNNPTPFP